MHGFGYFLKIIKVSSITYIYLAKLRFLTKVVRQRRGTGLFIYYKEQVKYLE